jgi:sulfite exporter TauE/SafE
MTYAAIFLLGLISGAHCLQMCGPIVLVIGPRRESQLAYHAGRILTYTFLGALAGAAGHGVAALGQLAHLTSGARIVSGAAMILAGILMVGILPSSGLITIRRPGRFTRVAARLLGTPHGKFFAGLALGFLPCGLIYAALLKAMDAATPAAGALTMLAFGLGTAMALAALGFASVFARPWVNRLAPYSVMIAGAVLLYRGLAAPHCHG